MKQLFTTKILIIAAILLNTNFLFAQYFQRVIHNGSSFPSTSVPPLQTVSGIQITGTTQGIVNVGNVDGIVSFHSLTPTGSFVTNSTNSPCLVDPQFSSLTFSTNGTYGFNNLFIWANDVVEIDPTNGILAITGYVTNPSPPYDKDVFITLIDVYGRIYATKKIGSSTYDEVANAICKNNNNNAIYLTGYTKNLNTSNLNTLAIKYDYTFTAGIPSITLDWCYEYELGGDDPANYQNEVGNDICTNLETDPGDIAIYIVGKVDNMTSVQQGFGLEIDDNGVPRNGTPYFGFVYNYSYNKSELKKVLYDGNLNRVFYAGDYEGGEEAISSMLLGDYDPTIAIPAANHRDVRYYNYLQLPCTLKSMLMASANNTIYLFVHGPYHNTSAFYDDGFLLPVDPSSFNTYSEIRYLPRTNDIMLEWVPTDISEDVNLNYLTLHSGFYYYSSQATNIENVYHNGFTNSGSVGHCDNPVSNEYGAPYNKEDLDCEYMVFSSTIHTLNETYLCEGVGQMSSEIYCEGQSDPNGGISPILIPLSVKKNTIDLWHEKSTTSEIDVKKMTQSKTKLASIYPNPFTGALTLQLTEMGTVQISVANLQGKTLYSNRVETTTNTATLTDLQHLQAGIYFVSITQNGNTTIHKVVKQ